MLKGKIIFIENFWKCFGLPTAKIFLVTSALLLHGIFSPAFAEFEVPIVWMSHSYFKSPDGRVLNGEKHENERQELANIFGAFIKSQGYRCDSISWMAPATRKFKTYYKIRCNGVRNTYGIFDKGGNLVVELL